MSEQPKGVSKAELQRQLENLTIEQCALKCDELAVSTYSKEWRYAYQDCAREIRELKK